MANGGSFPATPPTSSRISKRCARSVSTRVDIDFESPDPEASLAEMARFQERQRAKTAASAARAALGEMSLQQHQSEKNDRKIMARLQGPRLRCSMSL
jgi:hypothetical protein